MKRLIMILIILIITMGVLGAIKIAGTYRVDGVKYTIVDVNGLRMDIKADTDLAAGQIAANNIEAMQSDEDMMLEQAIDTLLGASNNTLKKINIDKLKKLNTKLVEVIK